MQEGLESYSPAEFPNINIIFDVAPIAYKPGGSRPGYVGLKDGRLYLVKLEYYGYVNGAAGTSNEVGVVESFTAQFIRAVWGENLATDIRLTKMPEQTNQPLKIKVDTTSQNFFPGLHHIQRTIFDDPGKPLYFETKYEFPYAIVVPFEVGAQNLTPEFYAQDKLEQRKNYLQIETIVKLLYVTDHKNENVIVIDNRCKLIDCGAYFPSRVLEELEELYPSDNSKSPIAISYDKKTIIDEILVQFVNFPNEKLDKLLNSYHDYLSQETSHALRDRILSLQKDVQKKYNSILSASYSQQAQFFQQAKNTEETVEDPKKGTFTPPSN